MAPFSNKNANPVDLKCKFIDPKSWIKEENENEEKAIGGNRVRATPETYQKWKEVNNNIANNWKKLSDREKAEAVKSIKLDLINLKNLLKENRNNQDHLFIREPF